ncbi:MAG: hypothetical protein H7Y12_04500 [Sphingobacteriaceae bacterium]|nr:hypothetical protein [Cytophagaceae bacterium]
MNPWFSTLTFALLLALGGLVRQPAPRRATPALSIEELSARIPICGQSHVGGIPSDVLRQPVALRTGLGAVPTPTSTKSPQAQAFFEQGMAYLHGYVLVEAARSFHEALRHDSTLVLAHVGLSRVYSQLDDTTAARREVRRAQTLAHFASGREHAHITVRLAQLRAIDELTSKSRRLAYRRALRRATRQFPDDVELWLLAGNAQENLASGRGQGSTPEGIAVYEKILQLAPDLPAAHHFLIHSYEGTKAYDKALLHGEVYARLAPNLPHARHMYAHDLMKTGQIDAAIARLAGADSIERRTYETERYKPDYDWHHAHNLTLLALCYQYQGRLAEAEVLLRRVYAMTRPGDAKWAFYTKKSYPELLLALGRSAEAEALATELTKGKTAGERFLGHYLLGRAHVQGSRWAEARREATATGAELATLRQSDPTGAVAGRLRPFSRYLTALLDLHESGNRPEALAKVRDFQQSARNQFGPDGWIEALFQLETIAELAQAASMTAFAEEAAKTLADHDAGYAGTHHALAGLARQRGDEAAVQRERALAELGWQRADAAFRKRVGLN